MTLLTQPLQTRYAKTPLVKTHQSRLSNSWYLWLVLQPKPTYHHTRYV